MMYDVEWMDAKGEGMMMYDVEWIDAVNKDYESSQKS